MGKHEITTEKVYQHGKPYGYITLSINMATYIIDFNIFGIAIPVETVRTTDYNNALNKFTIMRNKYNN